MSTPEHVEMSCLESEYLQNSVSRPALERRAEQLTGLCNKAPEVWYKVADASPAATATSFPRHMRSFRKANVLLRVRGQVLSTVRSLLVRFSVRRVWMLGNSLIVLSVGPLQLWCRRSCVSGHKCTGCLKCCILACLLCSSQYPCSELHS